MPRLRAPPTTARRWRASKPGSTSTRAAPHDHRDAVSPRHLGTRRALLTRTDDPRQRHRRRRGAGRGSRRPRLCPTDELRLPPPQRRVRHAVRLRERARRLPAPNKLLDELRPILCRHAGLHLPDYECRGSPAKDASSNRASPPGCRYRSWRNRCTLAAPQVQAVSPARVRAEVQARAPSDAPRPIFERPHGGQINPGIRPVGARPRLSCPSWARRSGAASPPA